VIVARPPTPPRAPRRPRSRVGWIAAAVSVAFHLLLFLVIRFEFVLEPRSAPPVVRAYQLRPAMQAYEITPVEVLAGQIEPVLPPPRELVPDRTVPVLSAPATPAVPPPARTPTLGERLGRTPTADLELWRPVTPGTYERPLTEEEVLRARLAARMNAYNDSVAAEAGARERSTDWTVADAEGGKWGVSPGKVHLGGITLPLPVAFSTPPGRREEVAAKTRSWSETRAQASRAEADDNFQERVKAIRERRQAQRDSARAEGS
jgi:hypothetical protein